MSNLILLNIGHDISNFCAQLDRSLEEVRSSSAVLKILLWPIHYTLAILKILSNYAGQGTKQAYNYSIPWTITTLREHILASTPNSIYCFNKTKFLLFFVEMYFFCFYFTKIGLRPEFGYVYFLCKVVLILLPFLSLTSNQRLPFWLLGFAVTLVEICVGLWMITSWGYGINWENDHFYNHWKKHYRYRYASGNRQVTIELSQWTYPILKILFFVDYVCWRKAQQKAEAVAASVEAAKLRKPTAGALDFDIQELLLAIGQQLCPSVITVICFVLLVVLFVAYTQLCIHGTPVSEQSATTRNNKATPVWSSHTAIQCSPEQDAAELVCAVILIGILVLGGGICYLAERYGYISSGKRVKLVKAETKGPVTVESPVGSQSADKVDTSVPGQLGGQQSKGTPTKGSLDLDFDYLTALLEQDSVANLRYGILFLLALSSLGVYSIILAGWSSNSKYAFIGALRSAAQMISYEVAISLIILPIVLLAGSLNLTMITHIQNITIWFLWPLLPVSVLFLIAMLAETNRTPFDLPEAEAELVAGYNVDYSSLPFAMFFLGEYCNMILISTLYCILFLGGGLNSVGLSSALLLSLKAALTWVFFVLVRATLPRYRYDQLMDIGWKVFLPIAGAFLLLVFGLLVYFNALPVANELPLVTNALLYSLPRLPGTSAIEILIS